jgi:hypothetical protein
VLEVGASRLLPSDDGKAFLSEQDGSLWRTGNGKPGERIASAIIPGMWSPAPGGACYLRRERGGSFHVDCVSFASRSVRRVASLGSWPGVYGPPGFTVSPDGKWIFYQRVDQLESNIMLAEMTR